MLRLGKEIEFQCSLMWSKFVLTSQVNNDQIYMLPITGNVIPTAVATTTNSLDIDFQSAASNKSKSAIYNWQLTFSATVFLLHQKFLRYFLVLNIIQTLTSTEPREFLFRFWFSRNHIPDLLDESQIMPYYIHHPCDKGKHPYHWSPHFCNTSWQFL
jgi:hypothetical protein